MSDTVWRVLLIVLAAVFGLVLLGFLFLFLCTVFVRPDREQEKSSSFYRFLLYRAVWVAVRFSRIRLQVEGREKIDELAASGQRFLLVGNHISNYDPIVTWYAFPEAELAFISKPENFSIPFFGKIARKCLCLPIDRGDARKALPTIEQAAEYIREDKVSFGAYPEGTRNKKPEEGLMKFRCGVFKISEWADHVPIVILAVENTHRTARNFPFKATPVTLSVLRVLKREELEGLSTVQIGAIVAEELKKKLYPDTVL